MPELCARSVVCSLFASSSCYHRHWSSMLRPLTLLPASAVASNMRMCAANVTKESLQLGPNIRTVDWAPQQDVLAHGVSAFITQGGGPTDWLAAPLHACGSRKLSWRSEAVRWLWPGNSLWRFDAHAFS